MSRRFASVEEFERELRPWLQQHRRPAWRPVLQARKGTATQSKFGGTPWLDIGEQWPRCGGCQQPMHFFLQLDLAALPEALHGRHGTGLLQLFYCSTVERSLAGARLREQVGDKVEHVCEAEDFVAFSPAHHLRIVRPTHDRVLAMPPVRPLECKVIVGWEPVDDFPSGEDYEALGLHSKHNFATRIVHLTSDDGRIDLVGPYEIEGEFCLEGDKLGGWPYWAQAAEQPSCPQCDTPMQLLLQVDSNNGLDFMFGDMGMAHLTQCPHHHDVLAFAWACG